MKFNPKFENCHPLCIWHQQWLEDEKQEFVQNYPNIEYRDWFADNKKLNRIKKMEKHTCCNIDCWCHGSSDKSGGPLFQGKPQSFLASDKHKTRAHLKNHHILVRHLFMLSITFMLIFCKYCSNIAIILLQFHLRF